MQGPLVQYVHDAGRVQDPAVHPPLVRVSLMNVSGAEGLTCCHFDFRQKSEQQPVGVGGD